MDDFGARAYSSNLDAAYDCVKAFSETDQTEDLESLDVPSASRRGTLKVYDGAPHRIYGAYQDALDRDILEFIKG